MGDKSEEVIYNWIKVLHSKMTRSTHREHF